MTTDKKTKANVSKEATQPISEFSDLEFARMRSNLAFDTDVLQGMREAAIAGGTAVIETESFRDKCLSAGFYARDLLSAQGLGIDKKSVEGQMADARYQSLMRVAYEGHAIAGARRDARDQELSGDEAIQFIAKAVEKKLGFRDKLKANIKLGDDTEKMVRKLDRLAKDTVRNAREAIQEKEDIDNGIVKEKKRNKTRLEKAMDIKEIWKGWMENAEDANVQAVGENLMTAIDEAIEIGFFAQPEKTKKKKKS